MNDLLTGIWSGDIKPSDPSSATHLGVLGTIALPDGTVFLDCSPTRRAAYFEVTEFLEPGLTVADVLAEEFDLYPSATAMVVLCPRRLHPEPASKEAGRDAGEPLLSILEHEKQSVSVAAENQQNVHQLS